MAGTSASSHCLPVSCSVPKMRRMTSICVMRTARTISASAVQFRCRLSNVSPVSAVAVTLLAWKADATMSSENAVSPIDEPIATLS